MVRRDAKPSPAARQVPAEPPYYIATAPLFIGKFGRAHNVGDLVPVEHVATYGWADKVRVPDGYATPGPNQSSSEPETSTGQATTSEGKDA